MSLDVQYIAAKLVNGLDRNELMTITLTPEIERALAEAARTQGAPAELLALDCLRERFVSTATSSENNCGSLADFLADHIGVLSSSEIVPGGAQMSENSGSKFARGLQEKRANGRL